MSSTSSRTDLPATPGAPGPPATPETPETIAVGRILRPHGLRGEVLVEVLSDVPHRFAPGRSLLLVRNGKPPEELVVAGSRAHGGGRSRVGAAAEGPAVPRRGREEAALVQFRGIDDRERADTLRGGWLEIERSLAAPAPVGTYYHYELLGCRCVQGGADLGEVVEVLEDGGGLLLLVSDGSREVPVPFVKRFLCAVDVAARRIEVDLPPGLLEVCASRS